MEHQRYRCAREDPRALEGVVMAGLGEGRYYLSRPGYTRQFMASLGFCPYPGTLNVKLNEPFDPPSQQAIRIAGFEEAGRTFGKCSCFKIRINGIQGAIVLPEKSSHRPDVVEIIAPFNLRELLCLQDGDEVELVLQ